MFKGLLSIFLDFPCALCQRPGAKIICHSCQQQLKSCQHHGWICSQLESISHSQFEHTQKLWQGNLPVFAWGKYDGTLKRAIASMKYDRLPEMGLLLGEWLGESWQSTVSEVNHSEIMVVPIPLHQKKLQQRGFNQAQKIAEGFCQVTGYQLKPKVLTRVKHTEAMFNLNPTQRKTNINQAFVVEQFSPWHKTQKSVLLIDDIYTTGATVREAAKVLEQNNIRVMGVAVIATPSK